MTVNRSSFGPWIDRCCVSSAVRLGFPRFCRRLYRLLFPFFVLGSAFVIPLEVSVLGDAPRAKFDGDFTIDPSNFTYVNHGAYQSYYYCLRVE